ncbi:MAG TPA: hypothetical protein EYP35_10240 [Desulfobacterales bacterium]|nr:hypothetical protein [Desulfobacterales bacterium]
MIRFVKKALISLLLSTGIVLTAQASPDVTVGTASGLSGTRVNVPVSFVNTTVADAVLSISYDPAVLTPVNLDPTPEETAQTPAIYHSPGSALSGELNISSISGNTVQLAIENSGGLLPDGELAFIPFTINPAAVYGTTDLTIGAEYSDVSGESVVPDALTNGQVTVTSFPLAAIQMLLLGQPTAPYSNSNSPGAVPASIVPGSTSVLSWSFANADTVTIDHGIGTVGISGLFAVSPTETTIYQITATGPGGTTVLNVTVTVVTDNPLSLQITEPVSGQIINRPDILVEGTVSNITGNETGVTVNGVVALVSGNQFAANHVPLVAGDNIITVVATDMAGNTTGTSIIVQSDVTGEYVLLTTDAESGVSPLEVILTVDGSFDLTGATGSLFYSGPGTIELLENTGNIYRIRMTTPGMYFFLSEVEYLGATYADVVVVQVLDRIVFDGMLKAQWETMRSALIAEDIEQAVQQFTYGQQEIFREIFTVMQSQMGQIALDMQEIEFVYQKNDTAEYRIQRNIQLNGQTETVTYYIYFDQEGDGLWRIRDF